MGRRHLLPIELSVGLLCEAVPGWGEVASADETPVAMVGEFATVEEVEDSSFLLMGNSSDVVYIGGGLGCEVGQSVRLVAEVVEKNDW